MAFTLDALLFCAALITITQQWAIFVPQRSEKYFAHLLNLLKNIAIECILTFDFISAIEYINF